MKMLRFLHIPKTAGTTFRAILERQYQGKAVFAFTGDIVADVQRFNELPPEEKERLSLIVGHAPFETGILEVDAAETITFLREPVERVRSFCQHVAEGKSEYLRERFPKENFDLDKFLESGEAELSNLQTKMLINRGSCASSDRVDCLSAASAVELALDHLFKKITSFGLQECFDETLLLFSARLAWRAPFYKNLNTANKRRTFTITNVQRKRMEELNRLDLEVYRRASIRFFEIFSKIPNGQARVKWFRFSNSHVYPRVQWLKWRTRNLHKI